MYKFKTDKEVIAAALSIMESKQYTEDYFTNPELTKNFFRLRLGFEEREVFSVMFLTNQHQMIACEDLFYGTIDGATVYPREIVKRVLHHNAAAIVLAHNHPSGKTDPSEADKTITKRIQDICSIIDVRVLDHIIVTSATTTSFALMGLL